MVKSKTLTVFAQSVLASVCILNSAEQKELWEKIFLGIKVSEIGVCLRAVMFLHLFKICY